MLWSNGMNYETLACDVTCEFLHWPWAKNAPKLSAKYLMDRTCKIKQYLNYINWWYKSKYSSGPKDIVKSEMEKKKKKLKRKTLHQGDNS